MAWSRRSCRPLRSALAMDRRASAPKTVKPAAGMEMRARVSSIKPLLMLFYDSDFHRSTSAATSMTCSIFATMRWTASSRGQAPQWRGSGRTAHSLFNRAGLGFAEASQTPERLKLRFCDDKGRVLHKSSLRLHCAEAELDCAV